MINTFQKLVLSIVSLFSALLAYSYDFEADGIYYNITSMSNLEVGVTYKTLTYVYGNSYRNDSYSGDIVIPESVNYNNRTFSVTSIEYSAFGTGHIKYYDSYYDNYGCKVNSVVLPGSIREIGSYAFQNCQLLTNIEIPESVTSIGERAFWSSSISSISIPNSVKNLGIYCFAGCKQLSSIFLGNSVQEVGKYAFVGCPALLEVFITSNNCPNGLNTETFAEAHSALEIYVPSIANYGFGKEYLSFPNKSYQYSGTSHNIEWSNNLRAYNCAISESECKTEVNAGTYTKNLTATYSNGIDFSVEIPYSYKINKAPMNLTVNNSQREYGDSNPAFTCDISGFVNGENEQSLGVTPSFECEATQLSNVGTYRILASLEAPNYEITYSYGNLSVIKAPLIIAVENATKVYGNSNPTFSLSYSGLKNGETEPAWVAKPTINTSATQASGVGEYVVTASDGNPKNYEITSYSPGTLSIVKRDLTAKANDCERLYGEENPLFNISYIGFVNGDNESSLKSKAKAECSATQESNAGNYPITVNGGSADNYNLVYQDGTLTIKPLTVGFKDVYNSVTYNDMAISASDNYFNFIPEIVGPFSTDDFWIDLWFLDKDNKYSQHVATISGGDYAGNYVNTNVDRPMYAGKYIFNLTSKGSNPNVEANPSRAYLTVNRASTDLEWEADSPIIVGIGEKVDLGISYQADLWCTFNTDFDETLFTLSSEGENGNNPHWYATGLKEGETTLYFSIECKKNDMGFYDFSDSRTVSKRIKVVEETGAVNTVTGDAQSGPYYVYNLQGVMLLKTDDRDKVKELPAGLYIINGKKVFIK